MLMKVNHYKGLIIKDRIKLETAKQIFDDINIKFTCEGKRHLGTAIGTNQFRIQYVSEKVARGMVQGNEKVINTSKNTATCSLFCLHSWQTT